MNNMINYLEELEEEFKKLSLLSSSGKTNQIRVCRELIEQINIYVYLPECKSMKMHTLNRKRIIESEIDRIELDLNKTKISGYGENKAIEKERNNLEKLMKARNDLLDLENIGNSITSELSSQEEKMRNVRNNLNLIHPEIEKSNSLLNRMRSFFRS
jgi:hypothetical protein